MKRTSWPHQTLRSLGDGQPDVNMPFQAGSYTELSEVFILGFNSVITSVRLLFPILSSA